MRRARFDFLQEQTVLQLQAMPMLGPQLARSLVGVGVESLDDLGRRDPLDLVRRMGMQDDAASVHAVAAAVDASRRRMTPGWWDFPLDGMAGSSHRMV